MDTKDLANRCQSCGMPIRTGNDAMDKTFWGTNADGTPMSDFCKFCYQAGAFVEPALTKKDMIEKSVSHQTRVLHLPTEKAKESANDVIPKLKRWKSEQP